MNNNQTEHTFHIPVMGIGFTIDTPVKVAQYGISAVISLADDLLIEKIREYYSRKQNRPYEAIPDKAEDSRARRITAYLDLLDEMVKEQFDKLKNSFRKKSSDLEKYMELLPDVSRLKQEMRKALQDTSYFQKMKAWIFSNMQAGSIDVNVMTSLDREHYNESKQLPIEYNDAHAAVRGFAMSRVESAIVLSAGMNPKLYGYMGKFDGFYPDETGHIRKRIILKVSDYRSAFIQGKFLAKKGLWVSEYRIESGLNCGGHVFPTEGYLMGPILEEFKQNRQHLHYVTHTILIQALQKKGKCLPAAPLASKITAQGGVGTPEEHEFLLEHYQLDSVGWGSPFLLVPEVTNVDRDTLQMLQKATDADLEVSDISPLGVPFNSVRGNTKDLEKMARINRGKPGSPCPRKILCMDKEFSPRGLCTASQKYQKLKLDQLAAKNLPEDQHEKEYLRIVNKTCICVGLSTSALLVKQLDTSIGGTGVSVCPCPNI